MNPMTEADLVGVIFELVDAHTSVYQSWLSGTFAFVLSLHFAGGKLSCNLARFMFWLYAGTSTIFILRFVLPHMNIAKINERIAEAGYVDIASTIHGQGLIVAASTLAIMVVAPVGALAYASNQRKVSDDTWQVQVLRRQNRRSFIVLGMLRVLRALGVLEKPS